jgi:hypothetical protein
VSYEKGFFAAADCFAPAVFAQSTAQSPAPATAGRFYHFSQARLYDAQGRYTEAVEEFKSVGYRSEEFDDLIRKWRRLNAESKLTMR